MTIEIAVRGSSEPCLLDDADATMFEGKTLELDSDGEVVYENDGKQWRVKDQVVIRAHRAGTWHHGGDPRIFARWVRANGDASLFSWLKR